MATLPLDATTVVAQRNDAHRNWRLAGIALLVTRFIQGFIYWGGGSRRFIYAPSKLDPSAPHWMAYKFQSAMPGALFGLDHVIAFMLQHFYVLYAGVILFSLAELVFGLMLMVGLFTRLAALVSMLLSVVLMALFGWQGATCIDEWTMAACNLAMGTTLLLAGGSAYSIDNVLLRIKPALSGKTWFQWMGGSLPLPQSDRSFRTLALALFALVAAYNVGTYSYFRGSVVTPFHGGPVSPTVHHLTMRDGKVLANGQVSFHVYLDAGTPEAPVHVVDAAVLAPDKTVLEHWDAAALSSLPKSAFANDFAYNRFAAGAYGMRAAMGAAATITLPPVPHANVTSDTLGTLRLTDVDGRSFTTHLSRAQ
jgi:thiosulfate dehydrogenase [quinone] large subunit